MTKFVGCLIQQIQFIKTLMCWSSNNGNNLHRNMYDNVGKPDRKLTWVNPVISL